MKQPEPKYILNVQVPFTLAQQLENIAASRRTTRTALIRELIETFVKKETKKSD